MELKLPSNRPDDNLYGLLQFNYYLIISEFECIAHYMVLPDLKFSGDAWFLNSREESLRFVLADEGFEACVGNVHGTRRSHGHTSLSEETEMMRCIYRQEARKSSLLDIHR
ncbi:unnamed protein product [Malus baccata var. baccata]